LPFAVGLCDFIIKNEYPTEGRKAIKKFKTKIPKTIRIPFFGWEALVKLLQAVLLWLFTHKMNYGTKAIPLKINKNSLLLYHNGSDFMLNSLPHFFSGISRSGGGGWNVGDFLFWVRALAQLFYFFSCPLKINTIFN